MKAPFQYRRRHRRCYYRRLISATPAARIDEAHMLYDLNLSGDFKLAALQSHLMQRATRGTDLFSEGGIPSPRANQKDSLAPTLLFLALIGDFLDRGSARSG